LPTIYPTRSMSVTLWLCAITALIAGAGYFANQLTKTASLDPPPIQFRSVTKYTVDGFTFWDVVLPDGTRCFVRPTGGMTCDWAPEHREVTPLQPSTL
jgi:hypothetical protein